MDSICMLCNGSVVLIKSEPQDLHPNQQESVDLTFAGAGNEMVMDSHSKSDLIGFALSEFVIARKLSKLETPTSDRLGFCELCASQINDLRRLYIRLAEIQSKCRTLSEHIAAEFQKTYDARKGQSKGISATTSAAHRGHVEPVDYRDWEPNSPAFETGCDNISDDDGNFEQNRSSPPKSLIAQISATTSSDLRVRDCCVRLERLREPCGRRSGCRPGRPRKRTKVSSSRAAPEPQPQLPVPAPIIPKKEVEDIEEGPFLCEICPKIFRVKRYLAQHMNIHKNIKRLRDRDVQGPFQCDICSKTFKRKETLTLHRRIHTGEQPYACQFCESKFIREAHLRNHLKSHTEAELKSTKLQILLKHKCDACLDVKFSNSNLLREHHLNEHGIGENGKQLIKCEKCSAEFVLEASRDQHLRACGKWECTICHEIFDDNYRLKAHRKKEHRTKSQQCEICGSAFHERNQLKRHKIAVHDRRWEHRCSVCGKTFSKRMYLTVHMSLHTGIKMAKCDYCEERFNLRLRRNEHMVKAHPDQHLVNKPFFCTWCWVCFGSEEEKVKHHAEKHDELTCKECNPPRTFLSRGQFNRHLLVHTDEKPYPCNICHKRFKKKDHVRIHMYSHTGHKPYKCQHCDFGCIHRGRFVKHMKRVHDIDFIS